jgi:hypothetical protein
VIVYVESSAAMKLMFSEPETAALAAYLNHSVSDDQSSLVSGTILETELRRAALRADVRRRSRPRFWTTSTSSTSIARYSHRRESPRADSSGASTHCTSRPH